MKRTMPWSEGEDDSSSDDSSTLDADIDSDGGSGNNNNTSGVQSSQPLKGKKSEGAASREAALRKAGRRPNWRAINKVRKCTSFEGRLCHVILGFTPSYTSWNPSKKNVVCTSADFVSDAEDEESIAQDSIDSEMATSRIKIMDLTQLVDEELGAEALDAGTEVKKGNDRKRKKANKTSTVSKKVKGDLGSTSGPREWSPFFTYNDDGEEKAVTEADDFNSHAGIIHAVASGTFLPSEVEKYRERTSSSNFILMMKGCMRVMMAAEVEFQRDVDRALAEAELVGATKELKETHSELEAVRSELAAQRETAEKEKAELLAENAALKTEVLSAKQMGADEAASVYRKQVGAVYRKGWNNALTLMQVPEADTRRKKDPVEGGSSHPSPAMSKVSGANVGEAQDSSTSARRTILKFKK